MSARRAILATSDKTGVAKLGQALHRLGWSIVATAGTAAHLSDVGVPALEAETLTGVPEMLGGRVKTLHPGVFGGLLCVRGRPDHESDMQRHALVPIDLVACTYYPFEQPLSGGADIDDALDQIDIGGPAMVRAAAKNHRHVIALIDPLDYPAVIEQLTIGEGGLDAVSFAERRRLASKAFAATAVYDAAIARALAEAA